jgi:hypothetical protein
MDNTLYELVNPEFDFRFAGKTYHVRKANIEHAILYQKRVQELMEKKEAGVELRLASYCIYLILRESDPNITEDFVAKNTPAEIDVIDILTTLGFMTPQKAEQAKGLQKAMEKLASTSVSSSQSSPTEPGGVPTTSPNLPSNN